MEMPGALPVTDEDWRSRLYDAMMVFSPGAPIDEADLFAGRAAQIDRMIDTVMQRGLHAILYGERGVGKSSLANTFATRLFTKTSTLSCINVNCHPSDDFSAVWRKVFRRLDRDGQNLSQIYPTRVEPDDVIVELSAFGLNVVPIIILDEFDKIPTKTVRTLIANTIKDLSDHSIRATVIAVGVADSVSDLIEEHESISRCMRQIPMQRMNRDELKEIVDTRLPRIGMTIDRDAVDYIVTLSRGLPHYTHLFGQQAAKKALEQRSVHINMSHVDAALPLCVEETAQTIREQYHLATISPRKGNIYKEVLLSAALSKVDDLGYFAPADLQQSLARLLHRKDALVSLFGQHLKNLCEKDRGAIFSLTGSERKYRYRFVEPMMQPFVLLQGLRAGLITREQVRELAVTQWEPRLSI
jgi:Cdc6-like AAA superfamily ATPase